VRDKDTGKPIPGAIVYCDKMATSNISSRSELRTVADAEGRYKMIGLPRGGENVLRAQPPEGQPYLWSLKRVPEGEGLKPVTVDFDLKRGVWVEGRAFDKMTGKPVYGQLEYFTYPDNPNLKEAPGFATDHYLNNRADDGSYRVAVLPGKCLIAFRAHGDEYLV